MLTRRLIVCLDVKGGRVVKGTQFVNLRDVGDPVELAARYEAEGADEVTFLDISASAEERATLLVRVLRGSDRHLVVAAAFKAVCLALRGALVETGAVFSTKGAVAL